MPKKIISTSKQHAKHPFARQNTKHQHIIYFKWPNSNDIVDGGLKSLKKCKKLFLQFWTGATNVNYSLILSK